MAPELEQVVGAAQQFPLGRTGPQPRRMNRLPPWTVLTCPKTGSMVRLRWA
jgi:hypothetical protein